MGRKVVDRIVYPSEVGMLQEAHAAAVAEGDVALAERLNHAMLKRNGKADAHRVEEHEVTVSDGQPSTTPRRVNPATDKQKSLIESLLERLGKGTPEQVAAYQIADPWYRAHKATMPFELASKTITRLKIHLGLPVNPNFLNNKDGAMEPPAKMTYAEVAPEPPAKRVFKPITLPDGYYAIVTDGKTHFYRVSTNPKTDRRKMQEQASDTLHYLRWPNALHIQDLIIAAGVEKAQKLYADELG